MEIVNEIKSRLSIEDLVAAYVPLKKSGRNFKGLCPFHSERTPSFHVSVEKQLAYCFGCHKGGDHFKFIEEIEGLDFKGALAFLADKAGVELPKQTSRGNGATIHTGETKSVRERLISIHDTATEFFEHELWESEDGKKVLKYLQKRGLKDETIRAFKIGFSPDSENALYLYLLQKGYTREEICSSGLAIARGTDTNAPAVDRFRVRLMFPIKNLAGSICAFGGRAVRDGDQPKYLNSPETPIFHKSSFLYALSDARSEIRAKESAIIVEGYMDALTAHQSEFKNVVACGGTALTGDQLTTLKRFTKNVMFAFDRDDAGKTATQRAIELGFDQDLSTKIVVWNSDSKDPDECIREDSKLFEEAISNAASSTEYLIREFDSSYEKTPSGRRAAVESLIPFIARIKSPLEIDEWARRASTVFDLTTQYLYDEIKRYQGKQKKPMMTKVKHEDNNDQFFNKELQIYEYLLGLLLTYKETISVANHIVIPEDFPDSELQNIYIILTTQYNHQGAAFSENEQKRADLLSMYVEARHADSPWEIIQSEVTETIRVILRRRFDRQKKGILADIRKSEGPLRMPLLDLYQDILAKEAQILTNTDTLWQKR